ncbi:hypothetical protein HY948_03305 [Candidatus Gottesmanbacteria bacterium]|nr:hypothetical protein [Candidatus Gottesmanbacteria bacterium]
MLAWIIQHTPLLYLTQSIWRDEAFSILAAQRPLSFIFSNLGVEPPLYYVLLHFWMKLVGSSEIAVRSLSFLGFVLATIILIFWAEKLFRKHFLSWYLPVFFFFNPMLLYYAFEVRTYGWFIFFATLSLYGYSEKKWWIMATANILGFYNHTYMIFVPVTQGVYWFFSKYPVIMRRQWLSIVLDKFLHAEILTVFLILPWFFRIAREMDKLKSTWYFPVDTHLIRSVLGNMFIGYEGTPWFLWTHTTYLSVCLAILFLISLKNKTTRPRNLFFLTMVIFPLAIVIGISFIKPLFVNRYLIPVTIAEIFLVIFSIQTMASKYLQYATAGIFLIAVLAFNVWYPARHAKIDIRKTLMEINTMRSKQDIIVAHSPLIFFESIYYSNSPDRVFLYNPQNIAFPVYVGDALVSPGQMIRDYPTYPTRAFVVHENGTFEIIYTL